MNNSGKPPAPHIKLGKCGENWAVKFLIENNYKILARNWRIYHLELDIICEKSAEIVFVEVKTRSTRNYDQGFGSITADKICKLARAAQYWLAHNCIKNTPCHFDVICLYGKPGDFYLKHYKDAFELPNFMGGSNPYWQSF